MISAKIIADSRNEYSDDRITTFILTFPRFILSELNTHRVFSKNSASSRAIPFEKMVKSVEENPFIPIAWQRNHTGMQGVEYLNDWDASNAAANWHKAAQEACKTARIIHENYRGGDGKVTKQLCNRLLEPFMWHTVILTATEFENFFALRCPQYVWTGQYYRSKKDLLKSIQDLIVTHKAVSEMTEVEWLKVNKGQAEIHMMALAEAMWDAYNESQPKLLKANEWHIPFGDNIDLLEGQLSDIDESNCDNIKEPKIVNTIVDINIQIATARCARVSYTVVGEEGKSNNYKKDLELHDKLLSSGHMSPFEHCAKAMNSNEYGAYGITKPNKWEHGWCRNFRGFIQYRKIIENK